MRLSLYSMVVALAIFGMYRSRPYSSGPSASDQREVKLATEAAYRDGLYVGRIQRERGMAKSPPFGRWSTEANRRLFIEGYNLGYGGK
jgi:hypothetical protein